jgi:uncharacterized protein
MKIIIDQHRIQNIPVIACYNPELPGRLPLILIMHGFTGSKEHHLLHAYHLAQAGFYAVTLDLHLHGELGEQPFIPAQVSPHLVEVITRSVQNLHSLVQAFKTNPAVDSSRTGLMGISLGGAVIYHYLAQRDQSVKAAVTMVAGPTPLFEITFRNIQQYFPQFGVTDALLTELSAAAATTPFLDKVKDFPLLAMYGESDPLIPIAGARELFKQVKSGYTKPELLHFSEFPNTGHDTPSEMFLKAAAWFKEHL